MEILGHALSKEFFASMDNTFQNMDNANVPRPNRSVNVAGVLITPFRSGDNAG